MQSELFLKGLVQKFNSNLKHLEKDLSAYKDESKLWIAPNEINNSAGNLAVHLVGNLNHFIGNALGNTGYIRQRDLEFFIKDKPVAEILEEIAACKENIIPILLTLDDEVLDGDFPFDFGDDFKPNTAYFLMHLLHHLSYHVGQVNYHRRLLDV